MRRVFWAILGMFIVAGGAVAVPATVEYILDGDTFAAIVHVDDDTDVPVRVRLMNVDTPEMNGACSSEIARANAARAALGDMIPVGTRVTLRDIQDDKYLGRIDAYVSGADGVDVGRKLIRAGHGRAYSGGRRGSWCQ